MLSRLAVVVLPITAIAMLTLVIIRPPTATFAEVRARWHPSEAQLLDRNGDPVHELRIDRHGRRFAWTPLDEISPALTQAIVTSEDHRFWSHHGVDVIAIMSSAARAILGGRSRGASTITMQLASLLDPSLGRSQSHKTIFRKVRQIVAALALERRWSKREILEAYLNLVTYRGELQGIGAASRVMFGKAPHGIDSAEAVVLAALIRAPNAHRESVAIRANALSRALGSYGPSRAAITSSLDSAFSVRGSEYARVALAPHLAERLLNGETGSARCTLDRELQRVVIDTLHRQIVDVRDRRVDDGAVIVVENATGEVWAYVGGAGDLSNAPDFDAVRAPRQPGSTLKPFLYALAVDKHLLTAASLIEDTPLELSEQRGIYRPLDYDREFRGLVSMRTALASSLNVPAVRTTDMVGVEVFADRLRRLGFSGLVEEGDYYGAALALGSADVTLWQLVNAYRTLANSGKYSELRLTNEANTQKPNPVYSPEASSVISDILSDRASRSTTFGLENSLATRYWSAVKTGTSKDMRDNWCVGYTDKFTVGVWVGNSSGAPMRDVTGITGAAPTWLNVMNYLHDRFGSGQIVRPADVALSEVSFPGAVEPPRREWFVAETKPISSVNNLGDANPQILSPATGTIIALDPDIPAVAQRVVFEASKSARNLRWILDGRALAPVRRELLWTPTPGAHTLSIARDSGNALQTIQFIVRGSNNPLADSELVKQ
ncbi:penicillin-binding protein 1C [Candidatus Binatus sp.]|uniref:penicillin-binding protein 1C n=1 Tax=Candidatus Binatus sp. TaxID=2811406 RepID=UPI003CC5711C